MIYTTFNVSFYCRNSKVNSQGLAPIELTLIINGERTIITLPRKESPAAFKKAMLSKRDNDIKRYLEATRARLNSITTELMEQGKPLTAATLKEYFMYGGARNYTIGDLFEEYLHIVYKKEKTGLTHRTVRKYELTRDKFFEIVDKDKPATAITSVVISDFMALLRAEYNSITASGYGQRVKTVVKYAMSKGIIRINPFIGIHFRKWNMDVEFLTEQELNKIRDTDFHNESLNRIRDLFIFQSASGMSYCDMAALVPEDFQFDNNGHPFVHKRRAKTNIYFTSVILQDGEEVLKKYNYKLPCLSNNKYNAYLKPIKDICLIDKPLHTHIARHTYATRCINSGIRLEVVAKLLGHSTTRITQHYAKLLTKTIVGEVQEAFDIVDVIKNGNR